MGRGEARRGGGAIAGGRRRSGEEGEPPSPCCPRFRVWVWSCEDEVTKGMLVRALVWLRFGLAHSFSLARAPLSDSIHFRSEKSPPKSRRSLVKSKTLSGHRCCCCCMLPWRSSPPPPSRRPPTTATPTSPPPGAGAARGAAAAAGDSRWWRG